MAASPDKPLTVKQQKFAADVAAGVNKTQARKNHYRTNPPVSEKLKQHDRREAYDLAKQPNVAAEIRRQVWLSFPQADDLRGMREQGIRVISDLSRTAKSEEIRLRAAGMLVQMAEAARAAANPAATDREQDAALTTLRNFYNKIKIDAERHANTPRMQGETPAPPRPEDQIIDIQAIGEPEAEAPDPPVSDAAPPDNNDGTDA